MKKTVLSAKILIAAFGLSALCACGNGADGKDAKDSTAVASKSVKEKDAGFESKINIRYVDRDSLMSNYIFAVRTIEQCQKIDAELAQYQNSLERQLQGKASAVQQKLQSNGYLSEASYNADMQELQKLEQSLHAQYAKRATADGKKVEELTTAVNDSIDNFIIRYNKQHKYDAIIYRAAGLYFNPKLDITAEVVDGLNAAYNKK